MYVCCAVQELAIGLEQTRAEEEWYRHTLDWGCTEKGVHLEDQHQFEAAVAAYQACSSHHSTSGPVAAWSMYR